MKAYLRFKSFFAVFVSIFVLTLMFTSNSQAQTVIVDNGTSGTSYTGSWAVSSATSYYGSNSLWGRNGSTYSWHANLPQTGTYQVYMWWTQYSSRSTNAPVAITHATGTANVTVNQQINGGKWNLLGTYEFTQSSGGTVKLSAPNPAPTSYCADAVRFVYVPDAPSGEVIVDNGTSGTSYTGTWAVSGATGQYGTDSLWGRNGSTYSWHANLSQTGTYRVYMWWTQYSSRSTSAPVAITHANGTANVTVNQQINGGKWNLLGTYEFTQSGGGTVKLSAPNPAPTSYCADAVRFVYVPDTPSQYIIDNGQSGTSSTGTWANSSAPNPYGTTSLWSRDGATYTWHTNLSQSGSYQVFMWWTETSSRSSNAPVTITHASGQSTVYINQKTNSGKWNLLGTYNFNSSGGGTVKITAVDPAPTSYCADAVMFRYGTANIPPTARITSISPNPAASGATVTFQGSGSDSDGTITGYSWRSTIDGVLGTSATITRNNLTPGEHSIYFKVRDDDNDWSDEVGQGLTIGSNTEHIYYFSGFAETNTVPIAFTMLSNLGATNLGAYWRYNRGGKTYYIHFGHSNEELRNALMTPGAHIVYAGHANYGLGSIFDTEQEHNAQRIDTIQYIDDDRIFNFSSKWISVGLYGIRTNQAFPRFWPIFKDGTSGIMPYRFNDPKGPPPYNYFITYRVAGDPTYYKVETARNSAFERFFSSNVPAWYSSSGAKPDPNNTNHTKYFVTNYESWSPSIQITGSWSIVNTGTGYYLEDYRVSNAGTGQNKFKYMFHIPTAGNYRIFAWWLASSSRTTQAPYIITHSGGTTTVRKNQQTNGSRWNQLGEFYYEPGNYSVTLTNNFSSGNVAADAVRVSHINNPAEIIQSNFRASPLYGAAPLSVRFINQGIAYTNRHWDFGDGTGNSTRDDVNHTYTQPGTYSVTLDVSNPLGSDSVTKSNYIIVGSGVSQTRADFYADKQVVNVPSTVNFRDYSSGNIVSWNWNFGDGGTSTSNRPSHTYRSPGNYTVRLTVRDSAGRTHTETKNYFIRAVVYEKNIDNVDYPLNHYGSRTILFRKDSEIAESDLKYTRMAYVACNSGNYFLDTFHRGVTFYTLNTPDDRNGVWYLEAYLQGKTDYQIWQVLQSHNPVFDYYNFNKKPSEQ